MKVKLATMLFVCFLCFATCGMGEINPDSIISAWLFDEGKGDTVNDLSTAKHHGSVKKPKWVKGKFGSALEFDGKPGSMAYVLIEENIGTFSEMTFCAWGILATWESSEWFGLTMGGLEVICITKYDHQMILFGQSMGMADTYFQRFFLMISKKTNGGTLLLFIVPKRK